MLVAISENSIPDLDYESMTEEFKIRRLEEARKEILGYEFIIPNGDLKVGHDVAEWDDAPSPSEVKQKTDGYAYEERSGTLLTDDLQVAR